MQALQDNLHRQTTPSLSARLQYSQMHDSVERVSSDPDIQCTHSCLIQQSVPMFVAVSAAEAALGSGAVRPLSMPFARASKSSSSSSSSSSVIKSGSSFTSYMHQTTKWAAKLQNSKGLHHNKQQRCNNVSWTCSTHVLRRAASKRAHPQVNKMSAGMSRVLAHITATLIHAQFGGSMTCGKRLQQGCMVQ